MILFLNRIATFVSNSCKKHLTLVVFVGAFAWLSCLAWMRPLSLPDEGRYVGVAWEMLASGDFLTPTQDGMPFLHKPPLFYWLTALFLQIFGLHELAARGASLLGAAATVAVFYATLSRWLDERTARLAALILATQPLFFAAAQYANMDMLVAACISVAILLGAAATFRFEASAPYRRELTGAYIAVGLGVLTKGLIGLVIPALVLFIWLGAVGRWRLFRMLLWWPGTIIASVIVIPWFAAMQWLHPRFFDYFFITQQFERFVGSGFNNVRPLWFYVPILMVLTLPWSGWLPAIVRGYGGARDAKSAVTSLMWVWLGVVIVFFSIPQSKLIGYILPTLVPVAVLVALAAAPRLPRSGAALRSFRLSMVAAVSICVGASVGFAVWQPKSSRMLAAAMAGQWTPGDAVVFVDDYNYDLAFYLRAAVPIFVTADWDSQEIQRRDDWRKELVEAGTFAPTLAKERLIDRAALTQAVCSGRIRWVFAKFDQMNVYPFLAETPPLARSGDKAVWHISRPCMTGLPSPVS